MSRQCGECTLCCKLLPVRSLGKKDGERCKHQRHTGCRVYADLFRVSPECVIWNCRWLVNDDADDLRRPDRSHYVVDVMPDYVGVVDERTGALTEEPVVQVWVDPRYPDAHRDPALRDWIDRHRTLALIRYNASDGFTLFPPSRTDTGDWIERESKNVGPTHSAIDVLRVLAEKS